MDPYAAQTYPPPPPSQIQPQNPDPNVYNQSQPYPYYPQQQYPNPNVVYQPHPEQEHAPIHPPGVPVQNDPNQVAAYPHAYVQPPSQNDPYYQQHQQQQPLSYPDASMTPLAQPQWQPQGQTVDYGLTALYPPNGQGGGASIGRGGGRGGFRGGGSFQGRGRGRGRGGKTITGEPKPRCMAWCELCRVDCNTFEILENHKNGKKHRKNLKIQEDLQKLAAKTQESQVVVAAAPTAVPENPENAIKVVEHEEQQNGLKRKARDGPVVVEPSKKPKEIIPFICELCNVKCESAPTFDSHLKGKKHNFNLQRFQEQQATLGQAALQALYPALEALYPALLQAISQNATNASTSTGNASLDQQVLQWLQAYLPQAGPAVLPQGPVPVPGQGFVAQGPTQPGPGFVPQGPPLEAPKEPAKEPESKIEEKVEPESKTELSKTELVQLNGSEPEPVSEPVPESESVVVPKSEPEPVPVSEPVPVVSVPVSEPVPVVSVPVSEQEPEQKAEATQ